MTTRLGIGAAVAALLAAALTSTTTASATAQDPLLGAPVTGQCFDMSTEELSQPTYPEAAIDCTLPHTSQVVGVAVLPDDLAYESPDLEQFALESCYAAVRKAIGVKNMRALSLTAYNVGFFVPSTDLQSAGARWLRCDVVLGHLAELHALPAKLEVGRFPYAKGVSRCLAGRDFHVTVCAEKHTYRATAAVTVPGKKFPSVKKWQRLGNRQCVRGVTSRQFRFGWPSKSSWKAGDHTLTCYSRTKK
ncbi:Septum formation [Nocardioides exalbidus]|uniref:Septum formation n=1 Tax=Nocardioides exalbidus TaxID=402596 RepID=A0A1H4LY91_9ACTN|nr:septum formation family protein [Nocardioides exalbidus]SEB75537.1 Septum formation [Nocardioides exalbidus]